MKLTIASRGSALALWQARTVRDTLQAELPGLSIDIEEIRTTGDRILDVPLAKIGDKGLFTKEIDEALLDHRADLAVHSLKDVPTRLPDGLTFGAIGERADPRDALVVREDMSASTLDELPAGSRVGTSALRRRAQLAAARPDLVVMDIRGNLDTRLAKLERGEYDALVLAAAGLIRLGERHRITAFLDPPSWLPAVGQGALAIMIRADDPDVEAVVGRLHHAETATAVRAERSLLAALEGGCQVPIGAHGRVVDGRVRLEGLVADPAGDPLLRGSEEGAAEDAAGVGRRLAERLRTQGAEAILAGIRLNAR